MSKKTNKSITSQSGQLCKGNRKGDMVARGWGEETWGRVGGKAFRGGMCELRFKCGGTSHSKTWDTMPGHKNQQVQRAWGNDDGNVLEKCL